MKKFVVTFEFDDDISIETFCQSLNDQIIDHVTYIDEYYTGRKKRNDNSSFLNEQGD